MLLLHPSTPRRASRRRRMLAEGLEHAVGDARPRRAYLTCRIPVARDRVLACAPELLAIAAALRSQRPLPEAGLADVQALLTDATGPLYDRGLDLRGALWDVERELGLS